MRKLSQLATGMILLATIPLSGCGGTSGQATHPDLSPATSANDGRLGIGVTYTRSDRITFSGSNARDGNDEVFTVNPDGTELARLTDTTAADREPSWSPDRSKVTFTRTRDRGEPIMASGFDIPQRADIWVMNADGTDSERVFEARKEAGYRYAAYPRFSPDGTRIAAAVYKEDGSSALLLMESHPATNSSSVRYREVTDLGGVPSWSPDGQKIVFAARVKDDPRFRLFVVNVARDNPDRKQITLPPVAYFPPDVGPTTTARYSQDTSPAWSPDGSAIYFTRTTLSYDSAGKQTIDVGIHKCAPDGQSITRLTTGRDYGVAFSPNGAEVVFVRFNVTADNLDPLPSNAALFIATASNPGNTAHEIDQPVIVGPPDW